MDRSTALGLLSATHAEVLAMAEQGLHEDAIAARLDLDPAAIGPLLQVAQSKLAALQERDDTATGSGR